MEVVFNRWAEIVGATMAARTRPARVDGETLVLVCDEPGVGTHLRYLEADLLRRIAELSGDNRIRRIQLQVEPC
jgi:predicted nucleic acid-binding Zn ribbon protein